MKTFLQICDLDALVEEYRWIFFHELIDEIDDDDFTDYTRICWSCHEVTRSFDAPLDNCYIFA